ncbi:hypothetical protein [Kribbella sp. NPDC048928]|uniref:hypothetical protein n=1 Tax=Kribbella sp. NPDC048928 TaxID=3364111 RepID=UPI00372481F2
MLSQSTFIIPPEIQAGLASGDLIQYGGVIRNQLGHIVKHLKEVQLPVGNKAAAARVAAALKNPRMLIPTLVVGAVAAGGAAFAAAKKHKRAAVPECVRAYNATLGTYLEAVHEGRLDADIIQRLITALDAVVAYDENGSIVLDFSTSQAQLLVKLVLDSTRQLAEENSVHLTELLEQVPASDGGTVVDLRRYLEVQRKLFTDAA